jgi:hypothetical protein
MIITVGLATVSGEGVHVMHDIELAVIITKRILCNRIGLIYSELNDEKDLCLLLFFAVLLVDPI